MRILDRVVNSKIEKESVLKSEKNPDLQKKFEVGQLGRLKDKRADLSENRGDSRRNQTGGSKKPKQKHV